jgi:hypothetical protein
MSATESAMSTSETDIAPGTSMSAAGTAIAPGTSMSVQDKICELQ